MTSAVSFPYALSRVSLGVLLVSGRGALSFPLRLLGRGVSRKFWGVRLRGRNDWGPSESEEEENGDDGDNVDPNCVIKAGCSLLVTP